MAKTKPISIAEAAKAPTFLPELDLARLNADYFRMDACKEKAQQAIRIFEEARAQFETQLKSAQRSVNVVFQEWDTNTGQLKQ